LRGHLSLVLGSPVCDVGRAWAAACAIAAPASVRSVIQLAGRVRRHRPGTAPTAPNLVVFDTNLKALEQPGKAAFIRPGFEKDSAGQQFLLASHRLATLRPDAEGRTDAGEPVDAVPRIRPFPEALAHARSHWVALEHARMETTMQPLPDAALRPAPAAGGRPSARRGAGTWPQDVL